MKAIAFNEFGSAEVLKLVELPLPSPAAREVLVRVEAVTIDNVDVIIRKGLYPTELRHPAITGRDLVGTVVALGEDVREFRPGDAVWSNSAGFDGRMGATAEYTVVEADRLYPLPASVDSRKLVASVHAASTANIVTREVMKLNPGDRVLIEGAAGNVGRKFVQCAEALGARVLTTSSPRDVKMLEALGAERCFSYDATGMAELSRASRELDIRHIVDTSGRVPLAQNLALLGRGGQLTMITPPPKNTAFDASLFYMRDLRLQGFVLSHATSEQLALNAGQLNEAFREGRLLEDRIELHSLPEVPHLHARLEERGAHGMKYVVEVH